MRKLLLASFLLASGTPLMAQSPLTTTFAANNGGGNGHTVYFDVTVAVPLLFHQIDLNLYTGSVSGTVDMYYCATSYVGNDTNAGVWALGGSGPVTAMPMNTPSICAISPFALSPGNYGMALLFHNVAPAYTNGTGPPGMPGSGSNQTYYRTELTLRAGASSDWGLGTVICCDPRVVNCAIHYSLGSGSLATKVSYGAGCNPAAGNATFYELHTAAFDLSNTSLSMSNLGSGYLVLPGTAVWHTPTSAPVAIGDEQVLQFPLGWSLPYPGGTTTDLWISSNGFVNATVNVLSMFWGCPRFLVSNGPCWAAFWCDLDPTAGGSVTFDSDPVNGNAFVTFDHVVRSGTSLPNTFQYQFHSTGNVEILWQSCPTTFCLTGWSPGADNLDPGSIDLSSTPYVVTLPDSYPLRLSGDVRPQLGATVSLTITEIPANALVSAMIYGLTKHAAGLSLTGIGMPGCSQFVSMDSVVLLLGGPSASHSFSMPNSAAFAGLHVICQGATYDPAGGHNALGALSTNGLDLGINVN